MKIISGGQAGVDMAALQAALEFDLPIGGWCSPDRINEDGVIPDFFQLVETPEDTSIYAPDVPRSLRTEWNVRDSDATLLFLPKNYILDMGTQWTIKFISFYKKLFFDCDPYKTNNHKMILKWIRSNHIEVLNIAGPSEINYPGISQVVYSILLQIFEKLK